jgi:hypothetical protein
LNLAKTFRGAEANVQNEPLEWIAQAFRRHLDGLHALLSLPGWMVDASDVWQASRAGATRSVLGRVDPPDEELAPRAEEVSRVALGLMREFWVRRAPADQAAARGRAADLVERFAKGMRPFAQWGLEALYSSAMVQLWTAYEALATDLWVEAVNLRPRPLAVRAAGSDVRGEEPSEVVARDRGKNLPVKLLQKYGFDVSRVMGTVLKETRKFDFNSLTGLRDAFAAVFGDEVKKTHFQGEDHDLMSWLEAVRNVIAHRGGRADETFVSRVKRAPPPLSELKEGDQLSLDGAVVARFGEASVRASLALLQYVDQWLTANSA